MFLRSTFTALVIFSGNIVANPTSDEIYFNLGTHGALAPIFGYTAPGSPQVLRQFNVAGDALSNLDADTTGTSQVGDLVELGFFDTDLSSSITPNTSTTDLFLGVWTPLTSKTTVGQDFSPGQTVGAGMFGFKSAIDFVTPANQINATAQTINTYQFTDTAASDFSTNVGALNTALASNPNPLLGLRFYDSAPANKANGVRYNTIMNPNWVMPEKGNFMNMFFYDTTGNTLDSNLKFEFDNSDYNSISDIGNGGTNAVGTDDFAATVTYYDGSGTLDLDNSGSVGDSVLSGLNSGGTIEVGDDSNIVTINATSGNTFTYSGTLQENSGTGAASLVKTGAGEQILTGAVNLGGTSTGYADVYEGTLTFKGAADSQTVEYLKSTDDSDGSTTPIIKLDNTTAGTDELIELGFANTTSAQTFTGNIELSGANSAHKIKIASGATDYSKEQIIDGTITSGHNDMTLVKDGAGRLTLHGDSGSTMGAGITIEDGTLVVGDGSDAGADPGTGAILITKGKLEVAENESIDNAITGSTGSSKSMIGGAGTITSALTVGDSSGEIDYISPGRGISSSLTPSMKGVNHDASTDAIGTLTVGTLNWNDGGVFDWQIKDFNPSGTAGSDWDKLAFTTLNFESSQTFDINIMALKGASFDGTMGLVSNSGNTWTADYATTNGFLFASGTTINGLSDGDVSSSFNIRADDYNYHTGHWYGDWGVHKNGGNLYLTYSVAPEPSTYMMVAGLLMLPGYNFIRRIRKSGSEDKEV